MPSCYTGVGSRKTPKDVLYLMENLATMLANRGWTLRSGGAIGADQAFERGCAMAQGHRQIFFASDATEQAMLIAEEFHPAWDRMTDYAQHLHGRNALQVLGADLKTPSKFLVCWTPDSAISHAERSIQTGGTGTAISIAESRGIPVFNLSRHEHRIRIEHFIGIE